MTRFSGVAAPSLRKKIVGAAKWTTVSFFVSFGAQFANYVIMARLLGADALGEIAIVTIVAGLAEIFLGLGLSQAIIQRRRVTSHELSSVYWINIVLSIVIMCLVYLASRPVADFFSAPFAVILLQFAAPIFLLNGLGQVHKAVLEKRLQFRRVAAIETFAGMALPLVTLSLILLGLGALGAVLGLVAAALLRSALFMILGRRYFRPRWHIRWNESQRFLSFGALQTIDSVLTYVTSNVTTILIGRAVGASAMGGFNLAYNNAVNLPARINPVITRVMFPVFSRIQDDDRRMSRNYVKVVAALSIVSVPLLTVLAVLAEEFVWVFYGEQWLWIAPLMSALSVVGMLRAVGNPVGFLLLATNNMKLGVIMNATKAAITIPSILVGASLGGVYGAVGSLLAVQFLGYIITCLVVKQAIGLKIARSVRAACASLPVALCLLISLSLTKLVLDEWDMPALAVLAVEAGLAILVFAACMRFSRNASVVEIRQLVLHRRTRNR